MTQTPEVVESDAPEPILKGQFAIYETPDGGFHLSYRPDQADEDQHVQIPGMYVKLLRKQAAGKAGLARFLGRAAV